MERTKRNNSIIGILFLAFLLLGLIANIAAKDRGFSEKENRVLQERPPISVASYFDGRYTAKLETWASDQFVWRDKLISIKTSADLTAGRNESNGVYYGKEHYLMEDITVPDEERLERTYTALQAFREKHPKMKMEFLLAPTSANIYKEKLPLFLKTADQDDYINAFFTRTAAMDYKSIDVRPAFALQKDHVQLYYKTDHHWTTDGAFVAYSVFNSAMELKDKTSYEPLVVKNDFRGSLASKSGFMNGENDAMSIYLPADSKTYKNSVIVYADTKEKTTKYYQLDNLDEKDTYTIFGGSNHPLYTMETPVKGGRRLLVIKDSYANSLVPFLTQRYEMVVVVDPRYFYDDIEQIIASNKINEVLFLYNANTFFADDSLSMMLAP